MESIYMKKFFVLIAIAFSILFFACEDETIPIPLPPSPTATAPTGEAAESKVPAEKTPAKTAKAPAKESVKTIQSGDVEQLSSGRYVIQVAVLPVEDSAKKIIKKLAENGIKAYSARVQDPDPAKGVIGIYYRVRIGFFNGRTAAETFAKTMLEPIGYAWWIDKRKNDNIGCIMASPEPPKQMSEQEKKDAEKAAAIAAAKKEYKAIAKAATAATAAPAIPPPTIPAKAAKDTLQPAPKDSAPAPEKK